MVGTVPGDITVESRPQGRGYVVLQETGQGPWPAATGTPAEPEQHIPAHEFHYARLDSHNSEADYAYDVIRGAGIDGQHGVNVAAEAGESVGGGEGAGDIKE